MNLQNMAIDDYQNSNFIATSNASNFKIIKAKNYNLFTRIGKNILLKLMLLHYKWVEEIY